MMSLPSLTFVTGVTGLRQVLSGFGDLASGQGFHGQRHAANQRFPFVVNAA